MNKNDIKQIIIYFNENLNNGFSKSHNKKIVVYIDIPSRKIQLEDLYKDSASFVRYNHSKFDKLLRIFLSWISDISKQSYYPNVIKHFENIRNYDIWRKETWFSDKDVKWKVYIEHGDGTLDLYLDTDNSMPYELESMYHMVITNSLKFSISNFCGGFFKLKQLFIFFIRSY